MKLSLSYEDQELLMEIFNSYDWFCDCKNFPECSDFKQFQKLKERIRKLPDHQTKWWNNAINERELLKQRILLKTL